MGVEKEKDTSALFGVVLEIGVVGCGVLELVVSAELLSVVNEVVGVFGLVLAVAVAVAVSAVVV